MNDFLIQQLPVISPFLPRLHTIHAIYSIRAASRRIYCLENERRNVFIEYYEVRFVILNGVGRASQQMQSNEDDGKRRRWQR